MFIFARMNVFYLLLAEFCDNEPSLSYLVYISPPGIEGKKPLFFGVVLFYGNFDVK